MRRKVIAIGDLHGDYHRLVRILEAQRVLVPGTTRWSLAATNIDVVLLGDYVDWRGEELEGDKRNWERGVAELMEFIIALDRQVEETRAEKPNFGGRFYPLIGNHDKLMLDAYKFLSSLPANKLKPLGGMYGDYKKVQAHLPRPKPRDPHEMSYKRCMTWFSQGGASTIKAYGGFDPWMNRMQSGLADFVARLRLGVVLNQRQYSHSVPDDPSYWRPIKELEGLVGESKDDAVEEMIWGRRIWGFDTNTGQKVNRPDQATVEKMLKGFGVQGVVVGHSLMQALWPVKAFEGKVVNIDQHGFPLSEPWLDEYEDGTRSPY